MRNSSLVVIVSFASACLACASSVGGIGVDENLEDDAGSSDARSPSDAAMVHDAKPAADGPTPAPTTDSGSSSIDTGAVVVDTAPPPTSDDLQHCVDVLNAYRAKVGRPPLARSSALEAFAAEGARSDSETGEPHGHFMATDGGGIAWAENEIPGWPLVDYGSVRDVIDEGTKMMWDEGPGGGHYENIVGDYTQVGCGTYLTPGGDVWITQDFR